MGYLCDEEHPKDPRRLVEKIVNYIFYTRSLVIKNNYPLSAIITMNETPVWVDMVANNTVERTGARGVTLKSTGHEKVEYQFIWPLRLTAQN